MKTQTIKLFFIALLSVSVLSGCLKDNDNINDLPRAFLLMVNAYTPSPSVIHVVDNNNLQSWHDPLKYSTYRPAPGYLYVGNRKIKTISPENKVLIDTVYTFKDKSTYTSFVFGTAEQPKQIITDDKAIENLGDKAALRFFHLANNTPKVNVYLDSKETPIYSNREIESELTGENAKHANFTAQKSGKINIIITDENNNTLIEKSKDLVAGRYYSIILTGDKNSTEKPLYIGLIEQ
ncbi:DUF4397 domain-containing protein [Sphingobacterium paucimobilis]|uniref:DUF4397 domain-containing protein n=1 Tax=Sphingobacterium paucimobilis HER1398 TaxID=1346330 RepID=U2HQ16_9SPHI|nr:DUF4397 domain-containing protein [Sphingobacterium paucimobilis]ERJ57537.1 hypothetical protein M472_02030 [Sphingobacterium paucimobilis HER1398]